jgi:hypothetical protein
MTPRRKKIFLFAALTFMALAALWFLLTPREPEYQGKKLSAWLKSKGVDASGANGDLNPELQETILQEAILAMGTNCLPFLWREYTATDSPAKQRLIKLLHRVPVRALKLDPAELRQHRAWEAIEFLGTNAAPLAPNLITHLAVPERAELAAGLLVAIGPAALPALHDALRSTSLRLRYHAACVLHWIDQDSTAPLPALTDAISQDSDPIICELALTLMISFPIRGYEPLAMALLHRLHHRDAKCREEAALALRNFVERDETLIPLLETTATPPHPAHSRPLTPSWKAGR